MDVDRVEETIEQLKAKLSMGTGKPPRSERMGQEVQYHSGHLHSTDFQEGAAPLNTIGNRAVKKEKYLTNEDDFWYAGRKDIYGQDFGGRKAGEASSSRGTGFYANGGMFTQQYSKKNEQEPKPREVDKEVDDFLEMNLKEDPGQFPMDKRGLRKSVNGYQQRNSGVSSEIKLPKITNKANAQDPGEFNSLLKKNGNGSKVKGSPAIRSSYSSKPNY